MLEVQEESEEDEEEEDLEVGLEEGEGSKNLLVSVCRDSMLFSGCLCIEHGMSIDTCLRCGVRAVQSEKILPCS